MLSLLIVDDEPYIVDGLYEMFQEIEDMELIVYKAYSAIEALGIIDQSKMDIVITDIEMPGMSGLKLHERIIVHWPKCRVIFLTGYSDFSYVQHAVRNGATDFILKTEGDEKIVETVRKAADALSRELDEEKLLAEARSSLEKALPALQREYLLLLSEGLADERDEIRAQRFAELGIELDPLASVLLVLGRVDSWPAEADKALLLYGMQNIGEEYLSRCRVAFVTYSVNRFAMFLQAKRGQQMDDDELARFVLAMQDPIQSSCKMYLKLSISLVASRTPVHWQRAGQRWVELERALGEGLGLGREALLTDSSPRPEEETARPPISAEAEQRLRRALKQTDRAEAALENGQKNRFDEWFDQVMQSSDDHACASGIGATGVAPACAPLQLEAYYAVAQLLLRAANRAQSGKRLPGGGLSAGQLDRLMDLKAHADWTSATAFLRMVSDAMFANRRQEHSARSDELVARLHQYIREHLHEDLSLVQLADKVYMNPSYLSRLYKGLTGIGLSDFIFSARMERAKELLLNPQYKVQEIGKKTGFDNAAYFARLFKKYTGFAPVEYREQFAEDGLNG